jgi:hypothetical protein
LLLRRASQRAAKAEALRRLRFKRVQGWRGGASPRRAPRVAVRRADAAPLSADAGSERKLARFKPTQDKRNQVVHRASAAVFYKNISRNTFCSKQAL